MTDNSCLLVLVEHGFLFYVSSAVNFEKFPADPEDVEDQDDQAGHPKDLAQAETWRGDENTGELNSQEAKHKPAMIVLSNQKLERADT